MSIDVAPTSLARADSSIDRPGSVIRAWAFVLRHPVLTVLVVALAARIVVAVVLAIIHHGGFIGDDLTYSRLSAAKAGGTDYFSPWDQRLFDLTATLTYPLTALYWLFGDHVLVGPLLVACYGTAAAVLFVVLGRHYLPAWLALAGGLVLAVLPSQVLFSSLTLKDAGVWMAATAVGVVVVKLARVDSSRNVLIWLVAAAVALYLLGHLRNNSLVVVCWAFAPAVVLSARRRVLAGAGALLLAVVVPWACTLGPAGIDYVRNSSGDLALRRSWYAVRSDTAFTAIPKSFYDNEVVRLRAEIAQAPDPSTKGAKEQELRAFVAKYPQLGSTPQKGSTTVTTLPEPGKSPSVPSNVFAGDGDVSTNIRHLPRGVSVMLAEPFPWQVRGNSRLVMALFENLLWWPLVLLGAVGVVIGRRRWRLLAYPFLLLAATTVMYALSEGNFGTAFRHRQEMAWPMVLFAMLGVQWLASRRSRSVPDPSLAVD